MKLLAKHTNDTLTIFLEGELDDSCVDEIREKSEQLINKNKHIQHLIYDFSKLTFMDSTGIGMLLGRYNKLKKLKIPMTIANPNKQVLKVIMITGLSEIINIK